MTEHAIPHEADSHFPVPARGGGLASDLPRLAWLATIVTAAMFVGLAAGLDPILALAAVVGLALAAVAIANLTAGLCLFVLVAFLESLPGISGGPSLTKSVGLLLVAGWLATLAVSHGEERKATDFFGAHPALLWALGLFLTWALFSLLWAEDTALARSTFMRFVLNFALFPIVFAAVRKTRHVEGLFAVFITGALLSAIVGFATHGITTGRLEGAGLNANVLGGLLMVSTVLGTTLACNSGWPAITRLTAFAAAVACAIGLINTASRGAMLGMVVALLATPIFAGRGRRLSAFGIVAFVALTAALALSMFSSSPAIERLTQADRSGSGRVDIWTVGLRMVDDKPILGVGAGNFTVSSIHYLLEPGSLVRDEVIVDERKVPHNIYLNVLAELGAVGLVLFLAILLYCVGAAWRAARVFSQRGAVVGELLARGLLIALLGLLAADFFSSQLYSKQLWLLLATAPALLAIARRTPLSSGAAARS